MNTIEDTLRTVADAFETGTRDDGKTFYKLRDGAPDWIDMHEIHAAVDGESPRLPDDWIYEATYRVVTSFLEYDSEDMRDEIPEIADGLVDVYNNDRAAWLASHLANGALVEEASAEGLFTADSTIYEQIGAGQYLAYQRIAYAVLEQCEDAAEDVA